MTRRIGVSARPESFFELLRAEDRDVARRFYKKSIDVRGMPVVAQTAAGHSCHSAANCDIRT